MRAIKATLCVVVAIVMSFILEDVPLAHAQPTRTWVSGGRR